MRTPTLALTHPHATRSRLIALAKEVPGAWIGIKIAALLLLLEGQRPGWIAEGLGLTRMSLTRWIHGVNAAGLPALRPKARPGRPPRVTPQVQQALAAHLEQSPQAFGLPRGAMVRIPAHPDRSFRSILITDSGHRDHSSGAWRLR